MKAVDAIPNPSLAPFALTSRHHCREVLFLVADDKVTGLQAREDIGPWAHNEVGRFDLVASQVPGTIGRNLGEPMKKTFATLLSFALTLSGMPSVVYGGADSPTLKDVYSKFEIALTSLVKVQQGGECTLEKSALEGRARKCREYIAEAAKAYLSDTSLQGTTGWTPWEKFVFEGHPDLKGTASLNNFNKLFTGLKVTACSTEQENKDLFHLIQLTLMRDVRDHLEGGTTGLASLHVASNFKEVRDCASAKSLYAHIHADMRDRLINKLLPLENSLLLSAYDTPKKREAFKDDAWVAALSGAASRKAFFDKHRAVARKEAAKSKSLPALNEKAETVQEMLSAVDRNFVQAAIGEDAKEATLAAISDANALAKSGDKSKAIELAKRIRVAVEKDHANYQTNSKPTTAKEQLERSSEIMKIVIDPNTSLDQIAQKVNGVFDNAGENNDILVRPGETAEERNGNTSAGNLTSNPPAEVEKPKGVEIVPDKEVGDDGGDAAAAAKVKKRKFKRSLLGAAYGAVFLGFFGMIFGGPIGALVMAAAGAAIMGGVVHMVNNRIS